MADDFDQFEDDLRMNFEVNQDNSTTENQDNSITENQDNSTTENRDNIFSTIDTIDREESSYNSNV